MNNIKTVNLINIALKESDIKIEFLYKYKKNTQNIDAYIEDILGNKYKGEITRADLLDKDHEYAKIIISLNVEKISTHTLKILDEGVIYNTFLVDNKNQQLTTNTYKIFTKNTIIDVTANGLEINKRKIFDKIKYEIAKQFYGLKKYNKFFIFRLLKGKNKYFLFNDRLALGDDNAEQLFKYINENHKKFSRNCYFVLEKNSESIKRISKFGKILIYGSFKHKLKYINCNMVISSHSSYYDRMFNPFSDQEMDIYKDIINKKFVFLQHGITTKSLQNILNRAYTLADLFITATQPEFEWIKSNNYLYSEKMVVCTGFSRFDRLIDKRQKIIFIAPTWRAFLTDVEYTNKRHKFEESTYFNAYKNLLANEELIKCMKEYNYKIKFLLHPVFTKHYSLFKNLENEFIKILDIKDIRYSELFSECSIFITDYSSTHFDVAVMKKNILYFQFDKEEFNSSHYKEGYFTEQDMFGPVIDNEKELVKKIIEYIKNNCEIEDIYKERIENTFPYLDNNNSKRIFEEILKLDSNGEINYRFNTTH